MFDSVAVEGRTDKLVMGRRWQLSSIARQPIALGELPRADNFQAVDVVQIAAERREGRGQAHDALGGLVQQLCDLINMS
jgi:hypothetical protein